jgi:ABC-type dipeptide/oligopeptide/nickel transport system permease component
MFVYTIRRLFQFIPTIIVISMIMFLLLNVLPGDAALIAGGLRGEQVSPKAIELMRKEWGLDKPIYIRYLVYMRDLIHGDLGMSFKRRERVSKIVAARFWPTLKLAIAAMLIALGFGLPLGFFSALRQGTWMDIFTMMGAVSGISIPQFWLGILLMLFLSVKIPLFPTSGYGGGDFIHLILPAVTLGMTYMALLARTTRAAVIEVLNTDYIRTAHAKGLSELLINWKHVLRNALILVLTIIGLQFGGLIGNTVIVEKVFSWPGIGSLLVDSIFQRDLPVSQGCILLIIMVFLLVNLIVDLLYALIDPRIQYR